MNSHKTYLHINLHVWKAVFIILKYSLWSKRILNWYTSMVSKMFLIRQARITALLLLIFEHMRSHIKSYKNFIWNGVLYFPPVPTFCSNFQTVLTPQAMHFTTFNFFSFNFFLFSAFSIIAFHICTAKNQTTKRLSNGASSCWCPHMYKKWRTRKKLRSFLVS